MKNGKIRTYLAGFITATLIFSLGIPAIAANIQKQISATYKDIKICIDGTYVTPKDAKGNVVEPFISNGTTYLPVRAVGEAFGKNVEWDSNTNTVYVGAKPNSSVTTGYGRNNPAPAGVKQTVQIDSRSGKYTVDIEIGSISRGQPAWTALKEANSFNDEAPEVKEYILFKAKATVTSVSDDRAISFSTYDFTAYSSSNAEYPSVVSVEPDPKFDGKLYEGASMEGWVSVLVDKTDVAPKVVYGENSKGQGGIWFSLA